MQYRVILSIAFVHILSFAMSQDIRVHDPVMIREKGVYYLFCTGRGISVFSSPDMINWKKSKTVFDAPPSWALETIPWI